MYAELKDIDRLMAQFNIGQQTRPSREQCESIIIDTEHEVNVRLGATGVSIPVASPDSFLGWLKMLVSYGATAAILKSMFPAASGSGESPAYAFWETRYRAGLKGIEEGTLIPNDTPRLGGSVKPSNYFVRNPGGEEDLGVHEPWFGRNFQS